MDRTLALSAVSKSMKDFGVCVSLEQPLLPTPLTPVFLFQTQDFHHLTL
jgi:hypothetical protein